MIRKILAPVLDNMPFEVQMAFAGALARRFEAQIEFAHCRPKPEDFLPHGLPVPSFMREKLLSQAHEYADYQEGALRERFSKVFGDMECEPGSTVAPGACWREFQAKPNDTIKQRGRLADLIVMPKPSRDVNVGASPLIAAILDTGRPVLMCPEGYEGPLEQVVDHVCIAWNGSLHASRAVALTLDVLRAALKVTVFVAGSEETHGASVDELAVYLSARGIEPEVVCFEPEGRIADALMERQRRFGASTMIMGAYSVSHEREAIFGGNTQRIVDKAKDPVIFVH